MGHGLTPLRTFTVGESLYWYAVCFGGPMLSQITHLACALGSKVNILIGTCGGLDPAADSGDLIVPSYSNADESTTRVYRRDLGPDRNDHRADPYLAQRIVEALSEHHRPYHHLSSDPR